VREEPGLLGRAGAADAAALAAEQRARERRGERARGSFDLADGFGFVADLLSLEEAAALLIVPALLFLLLGFLLLGGIAPVLLMDGVAACSPRWRCSSSSAP
jgi:hypothetical protein